MFKFVATTSTDDGRLTKGKVYEGGFTTKYKGGFLRIVVFDNTKQWMTFNPKVFIPLNPAETGNPS